MKIKIIALVSSICFFYVMALHAQNVVIDYQAWNPSSPPCNAFAYGVNVPATIGTTSGNILHGNFSGEGDPTYDNTDRSIILPYSYDATSFFKGTRFNLAYYFKNHYTYNISINAAIGATATYGAYVRANPINGGTGAYAGCTGPDPITNDLSHTNAINSTTFADYPISFTAGADAQTLEISSFAAVASSTLNTIRVRKISIQEIPPPPTINTTTSVTCGTTTAKVFTVTNYLQGAATYVWTLGTSNGWLYNGVAAPSTIPTTSNIISLTPVCGAALKNVSVVATVAGTAYPSTTSTVTIVQPTYSISGTNVVCSTASYSVTNIPCNTTPIWTLSPSTGLATLSCSSCLSPTLTKTGDGTVILTATFVACGQTQTVSTQVTTGSGTANNLSLIKYMSSNNCVAATGQSTFIVNSSSGANTPLQVQNNFGAILYNFNNTTTPVTTVTIPKFNIQKDPANSTSYVWINVRLQNACGWSAWKPIQLSICPPGISRYAIQPNPVIGGTVLITQNEELTGQLKSNLNSKIEITVSDQSNRQLKHFMFNSSKQYSLQLSALKPGLYSVNIKDDTGIVHLKLIKQ